MKTPAEIIRLYQPDASQNLRAQSICVESWRKAGWRVELLTVPFLVAVNRLAEEKTPIMRWFAALSVINYGFHPFGVADKTGCVSFCNENPLTVFAADSCWLRDLIFVNEDVITTTLNVPPLELKQLCAQYSDPLRDCFPLVNFL